ncbi:MAG: phycobilisome protein [Leptolyngbyaceae cyanobacterium]
MARPPLSEKVLDLIQKARIVSFAPWQADYGAEAVAALQAADDQRRYLTDEDYQLLLHAIPGAEVEIVASKALRDRAKDIVDQARAGVLAQYPGITQPGGGLHPAERADACWRDFWHFLRCITYGMAGQRTDYTSAKGLDYMQRLYQELKVPLPAMVTGLEGIKTASLDTMASEQQAQLAPYFDHLIDQLRQFQ